MRLLSIVVSSSMVRPCLVSAGSTPEGAVELDPSVIDFGTVPVGASGVATTSVCVVPCAPNPDSALNAAVVLTPDDDTLRVAPAVVPLWLDPTDSRDCDEVELTWTPTEADARPPALLVSPGRVSDLSLDDVTQPELRGLAVASDALLTLRLPDLEDTPDAGTVEVRELDFTCDLPACEVADAELDETYTLLAVPGPDHRFTGWDDTCAAWAAPEISFTLEGPSACTARFAPRPACDGPGPELDLQVVQNGNVSLEANHLFLDYRYNILVEPVPVEDQAPIDVYWSVQRLSSPDEVLDPMLEKSPAPWLDFQSGLDSDRGVQRSDNERDALERLVPYQIDAVATWAGCSLTEGSVTPAPRLVVSHQ